MAFLYVPCLCLCGNTDHKLELSQCYRTLIGIKLNRILGKIRDKLGHFPALYLDDDRSKSVP